MLQHTIHLQRKQGAPQFLRPEWYARLEKAYRQQRSITDVSIELGLPEFQVRTATYDLWRAGSIVRREMINEYGRVYYYITQHAAWLDDFNYWYEWQPDGDYEEALSAVYRYDQPSSINDIVFITGWKLDHAKRVVTDLWRAGWLERSKIKVGKSWWYVYFGSNKND